MRYLTLTICLLLAGRLAAPAWAASPRLNVITPRGVQRGTEQILTFHGSNMHDAEGVLFYEPGCEVVQVEPSPAAAKVTVRINADCRLGEHVAQVRTRSGLSDYRTFFVEALPAVDEKEPNGDFAAPQPIGMNVTVAGVVQNEDVDYYVVEAQKGQRISAEVVAMRLSSALFDPYVAILDSRRFELSANDDTALALQDCFASVIAPEDGKYIIEVRESAYSSGSDYRLHVGTFPRPTALFPAGGKLGEETAIRFLGDPRGELQHKLTLPAELNPEFALFASDDGGISPTGNPFRLFEHGNALEQEPNNDLSQATPAELPLALNGIIESSGDVDCFKFTAKKGQVFEVECFARRIRSALDPVMNLYFADGRGITGNDDARGPDSYFRFEAPEDAEYVLRITDHLGRGGKDLVYRVEFQAVKAELALGIPRVEQYGQYRQQIYVARGNRMGALITTSRSNFGGELVFDTADLPAGVTLVADPVPANLSAVPVLFEAAADAPIDGKLVPVVARLNDPNANIRGGFFNRADYLIGPPGQSLYRWKDVNRLAIAVVDELPFTLEIIEPKVPLVRDGSMELRIVAHRKEGFNTAINVQLPFLPPGVGAASSVNIVEGQSEVLYPLNANGGAEIKKWKLLALGAAEINGTAWVSSQLATLEIAAPLVSFEAQRASCEQGQTAQVYCKLNHATPFEGTAKAQLLGLPAKVTATDIEFTKDTPELTFQVQTDPTSPAGKHTTLFCQVIITQNGEPIVSRAAGTELQIDVPLPAPANQPAQPEAAAAAPAAQAQPSAKPLSRLEKLRLEAKKRQEKPAGDSAPAGEPAPADKSNP